MTDRDTQIADLLGGARVAQVLVRENLERRLRSGETLRVKLGVDPSRPDLHIGHYVTFRKLRQFQQLGHTVVVIIGDWTAQIGDPTGRSSQRTMLTSDEVKANASTYRDQLFKVIDVEQAEVRHQSEWFGSFDLADVLRLTARDSVAQMLQREDFNTRFTEGRTIGIVELLYPLLQAYDSVAVRADVEIGGTDQTFNLLVGRDLLREYGLPPQDIVTVNLLVGLDGVQKMSKSLDNYVGVSEDPTTSFGKLMSIPDALIEPYLRLVTVMEPSRIDDLVQAMGNGTRNPRDVNAEMAHAIVEDLHGTEAADQARDAFDRVFRNRELPEDIESRPVDLPANVLALLVSTGMAASNNEARRLVEQGGVRIDGIRVESASEVIDASEPVILQVGRRRFLRLVPHERTERGDV